MLRGYPELGLPVYKVSCLMGGNELEITFRLQNARQRMEQNNPSISRPYTKHLIRFVLRLMKVRNITVTAQVVPKILYFFISESYIHLNSVTNKRACKIFKSQ